MTDFVLEESTNKPVSKNFTAFTDIKDNALISYRNIVKYAEFLKEPLDIEMFKNVDVCEDNWIRLDDDFIFCSVERIGEHMIEDLIGWNVTLSEKAIKQIGR